MKIAVVKIISVVVNRIYHESYWFGLLGWNLCVQLKSLCIMSCGSVATLWTHGDASELCLGRGKDVGLVFLWLT